MKTLYACVFVLCIQTVLAAQDGLERYYPLDGSADELIAGKTGQPIATTTVDGVKGLALHFDGEQDAKVVVPYDQFRDISYSLWIKQENLDELDRKLFSFMSTRIKATETYIEWNADVHKPSAQISFVLEKNKWYHLVVTQQGTEFDIYVNGQALANGKQPLVNTADFRNFIGNYDGTKLFGGSIDEVSIWSRSISAEEVRILYENGIIVSQNKANAPKPILNENNTSALTTATTSNVRASNLSMWQKFLLWLQAIV